MPRKKSEFKPLTEWFIKKINPERGKLAGSKKHFLNLILKGTKTKPFDKKD